MRQTFFLSCLFIALVLGITNAVADEPAPWSVHGTVRDTEGKPLENVSVRLDTSFTGLQSRIEIRNETISTTTDAEGNYNLSIPPLPAFSKMEPSDERNQLPRATGFRFQHLAFLSHRYSSYAYPTFVEKSRTAIGDLIVIGDYATPEDVAELKKRFAEEKYDVVFVEKNMPYRIDFVVDTRLDPAWLLYVNRGVVPVDSIPPSWVSFPNYWVNKAEYDRRYEIFQKLILPYSMNTAYKEAFELTDEISVSLRFPKQEIMVGEPMHFDYVVRNDSDVDLSISVGGEHNGQGRYPAFTMRAVRKDDETEKVVNEIPFSGLFGGRTWTQNIVANGGEHAFDISLPSWLDIKESGMYQIDVARRLDPMVTKDWRSSWGNTPSVVYVASGTLIIKPFDHDAFGKLIDEWGQQATAKDIGDRERRKRVEMLVHVEDKRVIPWLIKVAEGSDSLAALSALTKFDDDAALAAIAKNINSTEDNKSHAAASMLAHSKHPEAIKILQTHHNHWNWRVRLVVIQAAKKMERDVALAMLREHFDDPGGVSPTPTFRISVAEVARRIYAELTGEDAE